MTLEDARVIRRQTRATLAALCSVSPTRILEWERGYAEVPPKKLRLVCTYLCASPRDVELPAADRTCWVCGTSAALHRAHVVPEQHGGTWRPENIADLCPTHHLVFDRGELSAEDASKVFSRLLSILDTCMGAAQGDCETCEYKRGLGGTSGPYCKNQSLLEGLRVKSSQRLTGGA